MNNKIFPLVLLALWTACASLGLVVVGTALSSCASLGLAPPQSFDERLANAYGVHTAVVSATATALTAGTITAAEAQAIETQEASVRALLDAARVAEQANASAANNDLTLALSGLTALQSYLNSQKAH